MVNQVNLFDLIKLSNNAELSSKYVKYICGLDAKKEYRHQEILDIEKLLSNLNDYDIKHKGFIYGYEIPQLGKEFDLIKVFDEFVINIELKSSNPGIEKIKKQLIINKHYLNLLDKEMFLFSYVSNSNTLYYLDSEDLKEVDFNLLGNLLSKDDVVLINLDEVFKISNVLVSPLNDTDRFINGEYVLTDNQHVIKNKILEYINSESDGHFYGLTGNAGTGKTLVLYDIAKEIAKDKKVLIIHSGLMCKGHSVINQNINNIKIIEAKELRYRDIKWGDIVLVDEAHRLYSINVDKIEKWVKRNKTTCVFSYDPKQKMSYYEFGSDTVNRIETICAGNISKLTNKIRTNKEIAMFITCLRDLSKKQSKYDFSNIRIVYEPSETQAHTMAELMENYGYKHITYTPSTRDKRLNYQKTELNTHRVIGQEFDSVVMVLTHDFYYQGNILKANDHPNPDYLFTQLLYQGLTRARSRICLIVTKPDLLDKILGLFN